jgi:hypothetical protein
MTSGSIVFLPLTSSSRIHLQRRHTSCRCARPLPTKVGTIPSPQFCHQSRNSRKLMGSFTCRKAGTWDIFYFRRKAYWGFFGCPGLNPRTRVPVDSMLTTRPPKPSNESVSLMECGRAHSAATLKCFLHNCGAVQIGHPPHSLDLISAPVCYSLNCNTPS